MKKVKWVNVSLNALILSAGLTAHGETSSNAADTLSKVLKQASLAEKPSFKNNNPCFANSKRYQVPYR